MTFIRNFITCILSLSVSCHVAFAQTNAGNEYYEKAYTEIANMLEGKTPAELFNRDRTKRELSFYHQMPTKTTHYLKFIQISFSL